jgi:hypothetical protein
MWRMVWIWLRNWLFPARTNVNVNVYLVINLYPKGRT